MKRRSGCSLPILHGLIIHNTQSIRCLIGTTKGTLPMRHLSAVVVATASMLSASPILAESADRSIALIVDASGSMKARLASGQTRMDAAKDAVETLLKGLPDRQRLGLWAYGHQSPTKARNCRDTQVLTDFRPIGENRAEVVGLARKLKPQGYTPITLVLEQAANGLKPEKASPSRVVDPRI